MAVLSVAEVAAAVSRLTTELKVSILPLVLLSAAALLPIAWPWISP